MELNTGMTTDMLWRSTKVFLSKEGSSPEELGAIYAYAAKGREEARWVLAAFSSGTV
jgi:hypothetical protein